MPGEGRGGLSGDSLRVGLLLAAFFGAGGVSTGFLPLWFADQGLSAREIGFVLGLSSALRVVGVPGGGWLADHLGRRLVLVAASGLAAVAALTLAGLHGLLPLLLAAASVGVAASLLAPITDAVTLALAREGRLQYGPTRAWGSVSYMLATAGAGAVLAQAGTAIVPVLLGVGYGLAALLALRVPDVWVPPRLAGPAEAPFGSPAFRLALLATVLIQGSHGAYYGFAALHWRAAGIGDTAIGVLIAEGIVVEIALFIWGRALIERLGPAGLTAWAAVCCALRWTVLAATTDLTLLVPAQLLHGVTFGFQHLSSMMVLARMGPGRAATAQTLMAAIGFSLATGLVFYLSGQLYPLLGGMIFLPAAVMGGLALLTVPALRRVTA